MDIGKRIRETRKANNQKLVNISQHTGLSQPFISEIERGVKVPSIETLGKICNALRVTLSEFFSEKVQEISPEVRQIIEKVKKLSPRQLQILSAVLDEWKTEAIEQKPLLRQIRSPAKIEDEDDIDISKIVLVAEAEGREEMRSLSPQLQAIVKDAIKVSRQKRKNETQGDK